LVFLALPSFVLFVRQSIVFVAGVLPLFEIGLREKLHVLLSQDPTGPATFAQQLSLASSGVARSAEPDEAALSQAANVV